MLRGPKTSTCNLFICDLSRSWAWFLFIIFQITGIAFEILENHRNALLSTCNIFLEWIASLSSSPLAMETLLYRTATFPTPKQRVFSHSNQNKSLFIASGSHSFSSRSLFPSLGLRKSVIVEAKKSNKNNNNKKNKQDTHSFVAKPDETTGPYPEAILLKEVIFIPLVSLFAYFLFNLLLLFCKFMIGFCGVRLFLCFSLFAVLNFYFCTSC